MLRHELTDSEIQSPIDATTSPEPSSKKRKATYSARGVASLTPEQLAKKRANDREAQRAIRERTKAQIESLERRIHELTSQQPYQELQTVLRQKDAIQAENDEIRRRLTSVLSIIQPIIGAQGLTGKSSWGRTAAVSSDNTATDLAIAAQGDLQNGHSNQHTGSFDRGLYINGHVQQPTLQSLPTDLPPSTSTKPSNYQQPCPSNPISMSQHERQWSSSNDAFDQQRNTLQRGLELNESGERLGFNFLLDSTQNISKIRPSQLPTHTPQSSSDEPYPAFSKSPSNPLMAAWSTPCRNIPPTCPLDGILLDFVQSRQREAAEGVSRRELAGPAYPSVSSLLNPEKGDNSHPLSQVIINILGNFPHISALPEQVAVLYVMFLVLRWQIYPTQENYERIPEWMTPRPSQLFTPHPAWIEFLPWPKMRDKLVSNYQDYAFENWFIPYTLTLSVNWPYEPTDCLLSTSESEELTINPVFERHVMRLENWSLGPAFAKAHPAMVNTVRIKSDEKRNLAAGSSHGAGAMDAFDQ
jgi:hypothetical protein